jgi:hypothetical protein
LAVQGFSARLKTFSGVGLSYPPLVIYRTPEYNNWTQKLIQSVVRHGYCVPVLQRRGFFMLIPELEANVHGMTALSSAKIAFAA